MISLLQSLSLSCILFVIGLIGVIIHRNMLFILLGLEIMINASALAFITAGSYWNHVDGQIMFIFIITIAATEACIGLALLLRLYRQRHTLDIDILSEMHG